MWSPNHLPNKSTMIRTKISQTPRSCFIIAFYLFVLGHLDAALNAQKLAWQYNTSGVGLLWDPSGGLRNPPYDKEMDGWMVYYCSCNRTPQIIYRWSNRVLTLIGPWHQDNQFTLLGFVSLCSVHTFTGFYTGWRGLLVSWHPCVVRNAEIRGVSGPMKRPVWSVAGFIGGHLSRRDLLGFSPVWDKY